MRMFKKEIQELESRPCRSGVEPKTKEAIDGVAGNPR
jgi:hypothetical protein